MKNLIVAGVIGTAFMAGGFWFGMRMTPTPPPKAKPALTQTPGATGDTAAPAPDAISVETLRKTSETMMALNQSLQAREKNVADREQKARQKEEEIHAEREALDSTHERFKQLFTEFQSRLQLVEASQLEQLQKQSALYTSMGTDQSIELIRAMNDPSMARLFSVMDTKPLAKLVSAWKTKYPEDSQRLLRAFDGMARVLPKEQIALNDPVAAPAVGTSDSPAPAASAPATDSPATDSAPAASSDTSPTTTTPNAAPTTTPSLEPPADSNSSPAQALPSPPDSTHTPVSTATTN